MLSPEQMAMMTHAELGSNRFDPREWIAKVANARLDHDTTRRERDAERTKKEAEIRAAELREHSARQEGCLWSMQRNGIRNEREEKRLMDQIVSERIEADALLAKARETT